MNRDDFWALIEHSAPVASTKQGRADWLTGRLAASPVADIVEFELHLTAERQRVDTYTMWGAASCVMQGFCSDDSFFYFQPWLIGLGRTVFDRVADDPDALAAIPEIRRLAGRPLSEWTDEEHPEWELLNYVALEAHEQATGEEEGLDEALEARGLERVCESLAEDDPVDYDEAEVRSTIFPRLTQLLG